MVFPKLGYNFRLNAHLPVSSKWQNQPKIAAQKCTKDWHVEGAHRFQDPNYNHQSTLSLSFYYIVAHFKLIAHPFPMQIFTKRQIILKLPLYMCAAKSFNTHCKYNKSMSCLKCNFGFFCIPIAYETGFAVWHE